VGLRAASWILFGVSLLIGDTQQFKSRRLGEGEERYNGSKHRKNMRKIREIGEHSIWTPGLEIGACVIDAGANHGRFSLECRRDFSVEPIAIEANPHLAHGLRDDGLRVVTCALGAEVGRTSFHIGKNDEASSLRRPTGAAVHLTVKESVQVEVKTLQGIIDQEKAKNVVLVKLDIEGTEIEVLQTLASVAKQITPQWTVEFHDDPEFGLCSKNEVNSVIRSMRRNGFSVLVRNWPSRTNVLFLDRKQLGICALSWFGAMLRYQYLAYFWRKLRGI
jgi:FkbM family methyltransferase